MPTGRPRAALALPAATLALAVVLAGCGGHEATGPRSLPKAGPASTAPGYRTEFPRERVRFLIGEQVRMRGVPDVLAAFIGFQVAAARALRTARVSPALHRHATGPMTRLVRRQVDYLASRGARVRASYRVEVRGVSRRGPVYGLRLCVRQHGSVTGAGGTASSYHRVEPTGVLLVRRHGDGRWVVAEDQPLRRRLRGC